MYLRLARLRIRDDSLGDFRRFYEERVVPALRELGGWLYAGLLRRTLSVGEEYLSLTLWRTEEAAAEYEESGLYAELVGEAEPYLSGVHEWRAVVGEASPRERPTVDGYTVEEELDGDGPPSFPPRMHVRTVAVKVKPGRFEDFRARYREEVIPALLEEGCRHVFLLEGVDDPEDVLSVSLWEREEDAIRYELSGRFEDLTARLRDTFSELYRFKRGLDPSHRGEVTGEDLAVARYEQIAGYSLLDGEGSG